MRVGHNPNERIGFWYTIVNNKEYRIKNIHFYNDREVIVSTSTPLSSKNNGVLKSIDLPCEKISRKNSMKFDGSVFTISDGKDMWDNLCADLYIPADMFNIQFKEYRLIATTLAAVYVGSYEDYEFSFDTHLCRTDGNLYTIIEDYEDLHKMANGYKLLNDPREILNLADKMKKCAESYILEEERLKNMSVDEAVSVYLASKEE